MRVKSMKPTGQYTYATMGDIAGRDGAAVLGPVMADGVHKPGDAEFKPVKNFGYIKSGPTVVIEHGDHVLRCDPQHRVLTNNGEKFAGQLDSSTDQLVGIGGKPVYFNTRPGLVADLYDLEIDDPHLYYTSGVVSHNSIWLCNNSVNSVAQGLDTLHITCEMSNRDTARRVMGAMVRKKMKKFSEDKDTIRTQINRFYNSNKGRLAIYEFNPEEISVDHISQLMVHLKRTQNFKPKVVVIDYLELLLSRREAYNSDEYSRQKHVSTEICGLAKKEDVFLYAATQTNRSGSGQQSKQGGGSAPIDLNQAAESYGKTMPVDYVVSLNQTKEQRTADLPSIDMFIAKNRHGPKGGTISCNVDYETMKVMENLL